MHLYAGLDAQLLLILPEKEEALALDLSVHVNQELMEKLVQRSRRRLGAPGRIMIMYI